MAIITNNPTANDPPSWLEAVWSALHHWRFGLLEEGDEVDDKDWDEVCTSMAWITEKLGYELKGCDYVPVDAVEPDPKVKQEIRELVQKYMK